MSILRLHQELIDAIVDEVPDVVSLRSLAVVSSTFLPRSQAMIFREPYIPNSHVFDLFSNAVAASALLACLPRQVTLTDNTGNGEYPWDDSEVPECWLSKETKLFPTMQSLPRLEAISIIGTPNFGNAISDSNAPVSWLFSLPNIRSVNLDYPFSDTTCHSLFSRFIDTSVKELHLHTGDHSSGFFGSICDPKLLPAPMGPYVQLLRLSISLTPCLTAYLSSPFCVVQFTEIKYLTLTAGTWPISPELRPMISRLLGDSLVRFESIDHIFDPLSLGMIVH